MPPQVTVNAGKQPLDMTRDVALNMGKLILYFMYLLDEDHRGKAQ
jgi:hypothetical protein